MVKVGRAVETSVKTVKSPTNHPQVVLLLLLQVHAGAARALGHYRSASTHYRHRGEVGTRQCRGGLWENLTGGNSGVCGDLARPRPTVRYEFEN